jgi:hypothetical protein
MRIALVAAAEAAAVLQHVVAAAVFVLLPCSPLQLQLLPPLLF